MTEEPQAPTRRRTALWVILFLLAVVPSGYLYLTGLQSRRAFQGEKDGLVQRTEALTDSLDRARTQLLLDVALTTLRAGDYEGARTLTSEFFGRVDRRSRQEGAGAPDRETRMRILALRDQAITELSQRSPEGARILEDLTMLHLPLADPELGARIPLTPFSPEAKDTLQGAPSGLPSTAPPPDTLSRVRVIT